MVRRGSSINTQRFPINEGLREQASRGARGNVTLGIFFESSLSQVSDLLTGTSNSQKLEKENICPDHFADFYLKSSIIVENIFIMKNLTNFRKRVETGVDPNLLVNCPEIKSSTILVNTM